MKKLGKVENIHFIGIGGIGMSGIAEVLLNMGFTVTGSDLRKNSVTESLSGQGAVIYKGHSSNNVKGVDVVVYSSAVKRDNVEITEAKKLQIPVIPRAEMLAELMRMKYAIAISGSHGKTSTTSITAHVLHNSGIDPTVVIGGRLKIFGSNARLGEGNYLVAEADESDKSFLQLLPTVAVITNIDEEHLDTYENIDEIKDAFIMFANKVPFYGVVILCLDDKYTQEIIPSIKRRVLTYGASQQADIVASNVHMDKFSITFDISMFGKCKGSVQLNIPGMYSVYNTLASIAVANEIGVSFVDIKESLKTFENAERRVELKGEKHSVMIFDDYGHHPTEIIETLRGIKEGWNRRLISIFQPHRYSRTRALMDRFQRAFYHSDIVVVTDIYAAGEENTYNVTPEEIMEGIKKYGHREVYYEKDLSKIAGLVVPLLREGDIVITLGAGDVWKAGESIVDQLRSMKDLK